MRNTIQVGHVVYKIIRQTKVVFRGREVDGLFCPSEQAILLRKGLTPMREFEVCWHESMHAIEHQHDMKNLSEGAVDAVACGIAQILLNNPHMRRVPK